jgi:hypothetical protein
MEERASSLTVGTSDDGPSDGPDTPLLAEASID